MGKLAQISLTPVQISIEPKTKLLQLQQGDNVVKITRDVVNNIRKLKEGKYDTNTFTSKLTPINKVTLTTDNKITIVCKDDWEDNAVVLSKYRKVEDVQRIFDFVERNKAKIAWDRDFFRR